MKPCLSLVGRNGGQNNEMTFFMHEIDKGVKKKWNHPILAGMGAPDVLLFTLQVEIFAMTWEKNCDLLNEEKRYKIHTVWSQPYFKRIAKFLQTLASLPDTELRLSTGYWYTGVLHIYNNLELNKNIILILWKLWQERSSHGARFQPRYICSSLGL